MSEHIARVVQKATRRRGPYGGLHYYAECSCGYRSSPRDYAASAERDGSVHEQRERQSDFVKAWRAEHWAGVFENGWRCPLCNEVVQVRPVDADWLNHDIKIHQDTHGQDYLAYFAAGQGAEQGEGGGVNGSTVV